MSNQAIAIAGCFVVYNKARNLFQCQHPFGLSSARFVSLAGGKPILPILIVHHAFSLAVML